MQSLGADIVHINLTSVDRKEERKKREEVKAKTEQFILHKPLTQNSLNKYLLNYYYIMIVPPGILLIPHLAFLFKDNNNN